MTGTAREHQREVRDALQTIVSDPQLGIAAPSSPRMMSNRMLVAGSPVPGDMAETLPAQGAALHPPAGPAAGPLDYSIL